jgi:hypothetical protein
MATVRPFPTLERPPIGRTRSTTSAFRVHASSLTRSRSATTSHTRVASSTPSPLNKVHSLSSMLFHRLKDTASSPTTKRSLALIIPGNIRRDFSPSPIEGSPLRSAYTWKSEGFGTPLPYWAYYYDDWRDDDSDDDEDVDLVVNNAVGFREKHRFNTLHGMKVHPYNNEAPYMQTYEPMVLERFVFPLSLYHLFNLSLSSAIATQMTSFNASIQLARLPLNFHQELLHLFLTSGAAKAVGYLRPRPIGENLGPRSSDSISLIYLPNMWNGRGTYPRTSNLSGEICELQFLTGPIDSLIVHSILQH